MSERLKVDTTTWCPRCKHAGQPRNFASPRGCAFAGVTREFSQNNWNCATMNALREAVREVGVETGHSDMSFGAVAFDDDSGELRGVVCLAWYKTRGRTDQAVVMEDDGYKPPRPLTLTEAEAILAYLDSRGRVGRGTTGGSHE